MENKKLMQAIANALGMGINEEFEIKNLGRYRFTETQLEYVRPDGSGVPACIAVNTLANAEVLKLPFRPKAGEKYWTYGGTNFEIIHLYWDEEAEDLIAQACGCVFRDMLEAQKARSEKYKQLTGKAWLDE